MKNEENGQCLATQTSSSSYFEWIDEDAAKNSPLALWTATISNNKVKFTNDAGQIINLRANFGSSFNVVKNTNTSYQSFTTENTGSALRLYVSRGNTKYYLGALNNNGTLRAPTRSSDGNVLTFKPMTVVTKEDVQDIKDLGFKITNKPLEEETSFTVYKNWNIASGDVTKYQEYQVTVRLYANGVDTGRTVTLSLRNGWTNIFQGLPYKDINDHVIQYTVKEDWTNKDWRVSYGEVIATDGDPPTYSMTLTNTYQPSGPLLPSTGSFARLNYTLCGGGIMLTSLITEIRLRRRKERRIK